MQPEGREWEGRKCGEMDENMSEHAIIEFPNPQKRKPDLKLTL